jgi:hypothetical protein
MVIGLVRSEDMRKGLDKMPYGIKQSEIVARLAFGCDFESSAAYEQSRLSIWWNRQGYFRRLKLMIVRLFH